MAVPKINTICDSSSTQDILQLFDDKCFKVVSGVKTGAELCLADFAFPSDGTSCVSLDAEMAGGEIVLFDNEILTVGSPVTDLTEDKIYVRGILLKITYPVNDDNGEEIDIVDKSVELWIEDVATLTYKKYSIYNFFALFSNPKSNDPLDLINRIKIVNPSALFSVKISGLIIHGKVK